ncbi:MAG: hypothetical protein JXM72_01180 [Deltaproteobacteria bacterium]|nr:hypothetical protein [Deltaproteobacteria bacterium]
MRKAASVLTNDPHNPEIRLRISGEVKPRQDISSTSIRLTGNASEELKQSITLTPSKENPFHITEVRTGKGDNIRFDLREITLDRGIQYELAVYNTKKDKGWYIDKIFIKTDSSLTPEFTVDVFGVIR